MAFERRGFQAVIGLEIHAQLKTESKIFSSDSTQFEANDNANTHPVSLGFPGTLPVLNKKAVELSIKTGLALGCRVNPKSVFARKNYFYPDLSKGYQISQYDLPICSDGQITFPVGDYQKTVSIYRAHMEEDAGKSTHLGDCSLINYNRGGVPLMEIVSGPDMHTPQEAAEYARNIRQILRYIGACDGNLEEGSLRCDCNVSVRKVGATQLGTKVEIKNINSFRFVEKAIEFEIERQIDAVERGEKIIQETRLWDPDKNRTFSMRTKEDAQDYRYFPDPDLLPLVLSDQWIDACRKQLPELPATRKARFVSTLGLSDYDADFMTGERELADFFEIAAQASGSAKNTANWIMTDLVRELNQHKLTINQSPVSPENLGALVKSIDEGKISAKIGKTVFQEMWLSGKSAQTVVQEKGLAQVSDPKLLETLIDQVVAQNPGPVGEYRAGKEKSFAFLVGAVMKATKGQANPEIVNKLLKEKLKGSP